MEHRRRIIIALVVFFIFPASVMFFAVMSGPPPKLDESTRPRARLVIDCARADGRGPAGGTYSITGRPKQSLPIGFLGEPLRFQGEFEGAQLVVENLPPMRADVVLLFESGERVELRLELIDGDNRHQLKR